MAWQRSDSPSLQALGDVAAGDREKFPPTIARVRTNTSKGRLMAGSASDDRGGFDPLCSRSLMTGKSVRQLTDEMENGGISAQMVAAAFQAASGPGGRFNGMMDKMSGTMTGLLSTLMDAVSMGLKPIGDAAASVLKPLGKFAIEELLRPFKHSLRRIPTFYESSRWCCGNGRRWWSTRWLGFAAIAVSTVDVVAWRP